MRVVHALGPDVGRQVGRHDLPEQDAVDEPPHCLERLRAVDLECVRVKVALARRVGALAAVDEPVRLPTRPAGVDAAVHDAPDAVDAVDVLHDVEFADRWPVPRAG